MYLTVTYKNGIEEEFTLGLKSAKDLINRLIESKAVTKIMSDLKVIFEEQLEVKEEPKQEKQYIIEIGSGTGKRVWFKIPAYLLNSWKLQLFTKKESEWWSFERLHETEPTNIPEWDCKTSLMKLL
jgi:hypothetical protein